MVSIKENNKNLDFSIKAKRKVLYLFLCDPECKPLIMTAM